MKHFVLEIFYKSGEYEVRIIIADDMQGAIIKMLDIEFGDEVQMLQMEEE